MARITAQTQNERMKTQTATPQALHGALADRFNEHDLDGLLALYDEEASLVPQPGTVVKGSQALRQALAGFLALKPQETFAETLGVVIAGDLALTHSRWGLRGSHPSDGKPIRLEHFGAEVMRRQPDGSWKFLIDDPFAGDR